MGSFGDVARMALMAKPLRNVFENKKLAVKDFFITKEIISQFEEEGNGMLDAFVIKSIVAKLLTLTA